MESGEDGGVFKAPMARTGRLKPDQDIVMTKWAGVQGTAILAAEFENELKEHLGQELVETAKGFSEYLSAAPDAAAAARAGAAAMLEVSGGGVFGALWEIAEMSGVGLVIDLKKIPIRQETIEISEVFAVNPYMLMSGGALLIGTECGGRMEQELKNAGIPCAVIGYAAEGNDRIVWNGRKKRYLGMPGADEYFRALGNAEELKKTPKKTQRNL